MAISSEDAKRIQFSGTDHSYDGPEVERFRSEVIKTLLAHEAELLVRQLPPQENLAAAQRARHQAVELTERMLRDVMGGPGAASDGLEAWQEAVILQANAEEQMSFALEEAKRITAIAEAERDAVRAEYEQERRDRRTELQVELQASRDAADQEVETVKLAAIDEANAIVKKGVERADENHRASVNEARRIERRLAMLHTALRDAESRFRRLASTAANEVGTLAAIMDDDVAEEMEPVRPELYLASVDLTDEALSAGEAADDADTVPDVRAVDPEAGFYQKRLAGLRDRLEKSGYTPE